MECEDPPNRMPVARCIACALPMALAAVAPAQHAEVRYGRDVRPILADRCFRCHGPDAGTREACLLRRSRTDGCHTRIWHNRPRRDVESTEV